MGSSRGVEPGCGAAPSGARGLRRRRCCCCHVGGPGLGRQLLGLGPLQGDARSARRKVQLSPPPSLIPPLLLFFTFFFPPCLLLLTAAALGSWPWGGRRPPSPARLKGEGQLPLLQPASGEDKEGMSGGWGGAVQAEDEHSCSLRQSPALWFGADVACVALL